MTVRSVASTLLVGVACSTGLVACGGGGSDDPKISDAAFLDKCKAKADKNQSVKAYSADYCKCLQDSLKAKGLGDKKNSDTSILPQVATAGSSCVHKVFGQ